MAHTGMEPHTLGLLPACSDPLSPSQVTPPPPHQGSSCLHVTEAEATCLHLTSSRCKRVTLHPSPAVCTPVLLPLPADSCHGLGLQHSQPGCSFSWTTAPSCPPAQTGAQNLCWKRSRTAAHHNSPHRPCSGSQLLIKAGF